MATPDEIRPLVLQFANQPNSGFASPGDNIHATITPALSSLADFDGFVVRLESAMQQGGAAFLAVPQELINCITWNNLVTQIALNQP